MCTVSVIPYDGGTRILCNRDERLARPAALPPVWRVAGTRTAVYPIDPQGGGTWVGVNDCGLAVALLNRYEVPRCGPTPVAGPAPTPRERPPLLSRGAIVPMLLPASSLGELVALASTIDRRRFAPFRLVAVVDGTVAVLTASPRDWRVRTRPLVRPLMLTSSALGDRRVDGPRRRLFARLLAHADTWLEAQQRFHRHQWARRPDVSVLMNRPDARTVSLTEIDIVPGRIRFRYQAIGRAVLQGDRS